MVVTRHPEPHIRRVVRVRAMVGELHRHGYQRLRAMPFMSPSGTSWRCWVGPDTRFYRNHGAILCKTTAAMADNNEMQSTSMPATHLVTTTTILVGKTLNTTMLDHLPINS
jgi:hypothetical protein